ncbi:MAG: VWA domain-containing protein [Gammaproteobacteria bacterium]|nr:VWA domain-containing protein [Gammaproteobacteria bacterium]
MARKSFNVFSLSFLDVMACGLGATILFLMIISAQVRLKAERASEDLLAEAGSMEQQVQDARSNLARLQASPVPSPEQAAAQIERLRQQIADMRAKVAEQSGDSLAEKESPEQLRADIQRLEEGLSRLGASQQESGSGSRVRSFTGDGNRQYLTGMQMGGKRVVILVDASASMLAGTYVNVVRYRAMPDARKLTAPKWRKVVAAVDWLSTQIEPGSRFQIYVFNEQARSVVAGSDGTWLEAGAAGTLEQAVKALRSVVPEKGTSLGNAFSALQQLKPAPDNIYLLTDGLPTQGKQAPGGVTQVKPAQRATFFNQAVRELPGRAPVNVLLYPMDGDPDAAGFFWRLAIATKGSFLTPSRDWP